MKPSVKQVNRDYYQVANDYACVRVMPSSGGGYDLRGLGFDINGATHRASKRSALAVATMVVSHESLRRMRDELNAA